MIDPYFFLHRADFSICQGEGGHQDNRDMFEFFSLANARRNLIACMTRHPNIHQGEFGQVVGGTALNSVQPFPGCISIWERQRGFAPQLHHHGHYRANIWVIFNKQPGHSSTLCMISKSTATLHNNND